MAMGLGRGEFATGPAQRAQPGDGCRLLREQPENAVDPSSLRIMRYFASRTTRRKVRSVRFDPEQGRLSDGRTQDDHGKADAICPPDGKSGAMPIVSFGVNRPDL
jgi:hypothetical protein